MTAKQTTGLQACPSRSQDRIVRVGAAAMLVDTARDIQESSGRYEDSRIAIIDRILDELAQKYPEDALDDFRRAQPRP